MTTEAAPQSPAPKTVHRALGARDSRVDEAGLETNWDEALAAAGEMVARTWRLYMAGAAIGFEMARLDVHQQLLALPRDDGTSDAPPTRTWRS